MSAAPAPSPPHAHTQTCSIHNSVSYPSNKLCQAVFLFFRGRLKINHLQRGRLMRWEKTPLYNLKISFLSTRSKTDGKTMEWQRASSDVMMCSFFSAPLQNALPVGTSSQRQFWFWKTVDARNRFNPDCVLLPGSAVLGKPARSEGDPQVLEPGEEGALLASTRSALQPAARVCSPCMFSSSENALHPKRAVPCGDHELPAGGARRQVFPAGQVAVHGPG